MAHELFKEVPGLHGPLHGGLSGPSPVQMMARSVSKGNVMSKARRPIEQTLPRARRRAIGGLLGVLYPGNLSITQKIGLQTMLNATK